MVSTVSEASSSDLFLQLPDDSGERVLHPARVIDRNGRQLTLAMASTPEGLEDAATRVAYFHVRGDFLKQTVRLGPTEEDEQFTMTVELLGEPISAEQRQAFRVSCAGCAVTATLAGEPNCRVIDSSATGVGLCSEQVLQVGDLRSITVHYEGDEYTGEASVQSVRRLSATVYRYGLVAIAGSGDHGLVKALPRLNTRLQREQLRRVR